MNQTRFDFDNVDLAIIRLLQEDGRRAYSSIAEELQLASSTVQQRANRLLDMGLLRIKGVLHPADLGHQVIAMVAIKANGSYLYQAATQIKELPEVRWAVICAGSYDLLIEVVCEDNSHLLALLSDKLAGIEGVRETVTFVYLDIVKRADEWRLPE